MSGRYCGTDPEYVEDLVVDLKKHFIVKKQNERLLPWFGEFCLCSAICTGVMVQQPRFDAVGVEEVPTWC
jgi:hypothetical protein